MFHSDLALEMENVRLEDLRKEAVAHHLAEIAQGEQPSRLTAIGKGITSIVERIHSQAEKSMATSEGFQVQSGNEQA